MVAILVVISLPRLVRAQPGAGDAPVILLHPGVATVFQLPAAIAHARILDRDEIRFAAVGNELFVRPRPGTPAGMAALLEVETRTARWTFQLVVVARARDARREVRVSPARAPAPDEPAPEAPPAVPADAVTRATEEPTTTASSPVPAPAVPEPPSAADDERPAETAMLPRFVLSAHAVAGLGFTGVEIAGYRPYTALQGHHTLGLRLVGASRGHWLSLAADVSAEWPTGPMAFRQSQALDLKVTGTRLRGELGLRASAGTRWIPWVHAGIGLQVHLRRAVETSFSEGPETVTTLARGAVLVLGLGLQHRVRSTLLGLDFQVRQGGPDDYFSVTAFLTLGRLLDQGE